MMQGATHGVSRGLDPPTHHSIEGWVHYDISHEFGVDDLIVLINLACN